MFHAGFAAPDGMDPEDSAAHSAFVDSAFDVGTAMMLPKVTNDLGFHCASYAGILAKEFYTQNGAPDALKLLKGGSAILDADWDKVLKDGDGRVTMDTFVLFYQDKYQKELGSSEHVAYATFLKK